MAVVRRRRYPYTGHSAKCSTNPEIGCVCSASETERDAPSAEVVGLMLRRTPSALSHPSVTMEQAS